MPYVVPDASVKFAHVFIVHTITGIQDGIFVWL